MELKHSFVVPVPVEEAWHLLLDLERIVPALPGASLTSRDGDAFTGQVKVKIGSIQMAYRGQGTFTERDESAHRIVIEAAGKDTRGAGTVNATIRCRLTAEGSGTRAQVVTDLALTGKPAQFGRGLLNDVGGRITDQFATNLSAALQSSPATAAADTPTAGVPGGTADISASGTDRAVPEAEPLDLMSVAAGAVARRAAAAAGALAGVFLLARLVGALRRRRR